MALRTTGGLRSTDLVEKGFRRLGHGDQWPSRAAPATTAATRTSASSTRVPGPRPRSGGGGEDGGSWPSRATVPPAPHAGLASSWVSVASVGVSVRLRILPFLYPFQSILNVTRSSGPGRGC